MKIRNAAREFVSGQALNEDPFLLTDMDAAVARINRAISEGEPIAVYGDFDADGVCATALLAQTLRALGGDVLPYIPDRADEGYGLNRPALENLARRGIKLVVTVDCGIRSIAEVEAGLARGPRHHRHRSSLYRTRIAPGAGGDQSSNAMIALAKRALLASASLSCSPKRYCFTAGRPTGPITRPDCAKLTCSIWSLWEPSPMSAR